MKSSKKLVKKLLKKVKKEYKMKRLRRIQVLKKDKKSFFTIESPYNSNEYLIEIQSTPFLEEEEEEKEEEFNFFFLMNSIIFISMIKNIFLFIMNQQVITQI